MATSIITLLLLLNALEFASGPGNSAINWTGNDGNPPLNWNYSSQGFINEGDVLSLVAAWTFPVPSAPPPYTGAEGVMVTPLVVNGIVYAITNWHRVFALNAGSGAVLWYRDLPLEENYSKYLQPSVPGPLGLPLGHYHQMVYTAHILGRPLVWVISNTYQIFALNALTGDVKIGFNPLQSANRLVQGNYGLYDVDTPMFLVDDKRGIVLFGPSVSEGESSGRGYVEAWNLTTGSPTYMWRQFIIPPQDGSDPSWSLDSVGNMTHAFVFNGSSAVDLKTLPAFRLRSILFRDWGSFGFDGTRSFAGASTAWGGSWAIDERAGVAFLGTSTATPDWNASQRPGLDLWSDSILALNLTTGKFMWGFQALPHPLGDFDCSWNVVLANETIAGQEHPVVLKGCKFGYIFALDAETGNMIWYLAPPSIKWYHAKPLNPLNITQMTKVTWYGYPEKGPVVQNPSDTGALESDIAYDPANNLLLAATYNAPKSFTIVDVGDQSSVPFNRTRWEFDWGVDIFKIQPAGPVNTTIVGIDAATGTVKWSHFLPNLQYRGGLTVTGGVVFVSTLDGVLRFLSEKNGSLLGQKNIGGSLIAQPSIGQDLNGTEMLFLTDMGSSRRGPVFPGFIQALAPALPAGGYTDFGPIIFVLGASVGAFGALTVWMVSRRRALNSNGNS